MPQEFADYIDFVENFVLPSREQNPNAYRLDGRLEGDAKPPSWPNGLDLLYRTVRYTVHSDAVIDRLLAPYKAWNAGEVDFPVKPGKTEKGADALISAISPSEHLYIYLKRGDSNKKALQALCEQKSYSGEGNPSIGAGDIDAKEMENVQRAKRDEGFRRRVFWFWGPRCAITGCEDVVVLDTAHINAHSETGDNRAINGIVLRCDLHRLLDRKLMTLKQSQEVISVSVSSDVTTEYYQELDGCTIRRIRRG